MCHQRRIGDWFRHLFERLHQRMQPVWEEPANRLDHWRDPPVKKPARKAKVKRVNKKK